MTMQELVLKNRSYRRFDGSAAISADTLRQLIELARTVPSTANGQAIRFVPVCTKELCAKVYDTLTWAAALPDWDGPIPEERPTAYVILLCDKRVAASRPIDNGICAQTILLGATEQGLGGCMLLSVNRPVLAERLGIDTERYTVDMVVALGKPVEQVVLTNVGEDGSTRYYRDAQGVHYVPKRSLEDLIVECK